MAQETGPSLRQAIDRGQTRDKVDFPDPATTPLGTDDEAAGTTDAAAGTEAPAASRAAAPATAGGERGRTISGEAPGMRFPTGPGAWVLGALVLAVCVVVALTVGP